MKTLAKIAILGTLALGSCAQNGKIGNGGIYQGNIFCKSKPTKIKSNHNKRYAKVKNRSHYKKHRYIKETPIQEVDSTRERSYTRYKPSFL